MKVHFDLAKQGQSHIVNVINISNSDKFALS